MQLVAYGAQDIYLTGNPQITFFKVVYRRHTNFAIESIKQTLNGTIGTAESRVSSVISRNGDLLYRLYLSVLMPEITIEYSGAAKVTDWINWTNNTGCAYIKEASILIGGQEVDKHTDLWMDIQNELYDHHNEDHILLNKHSAKQSYLEDGGSKHEASGKHPGTGNATTTLKYRMNIPLQFWFCRNPGLALPLVALQYHDVKLKFTFRALAALVNTNITTTSESYVAPTTQLWADYIYLDTDERRRFAQVAHEYLIEQVQIVNKTMNKSIKLNLNHPVKELIWVVRDNDVFAENTSVGAIDTTANVQGTLATNNDYFNYMANAATYKEFTNGTVSYEPFEKAKLVVNGTDRFAQRYASYFRTVQPRQSGHKMPEKHIYSYSFALRPEEHQPSGTCNFSRIDNAYLKFSNVADSSTSTISVFALNYNVLRIMSGMGGLAYSN